jgi:DNA gyrase inhibitor GyrI
MGWITLRGAAPLAALLVAVLALASAFGPAEAKPERPEFVLVSEEDAFEVREYGAMVVAQFTMRGTYTQAVSQGYIKLEKYFAGANTTPELIAMTVPTMVRDDLASGWTTMFVLPKAYRVESAPRPVDRRIRVVEIPPRRVATIVFPGKLNEAAMREHIERLKAWLDAKGLAHKSDFTLAGYDPPWIPGRMRKNEVFVTLK